jgi:hypothetical protein
VRGAAAAAARDCHAQAPITGVARCRFERAPPPRRHLPPCARSQRPQYMPTIGDMYTNDVEVRRAPAQPVTCAASSSRPLPPASCVPRSSAGLPAALAHYPPPCLCAPLQVFGAPRHIEIDDTAGQEAYADLKKEKMATGDVRRHLAAAFRAPCVFFFCARG